ncbi:MAG: M14 family metallopeptidase [Arenicellales bacterium]
MVDLGFKILHQIPDGLLEVDSAGLLDLLGGPVLIHLEGSRKDSLFLSVMLHGNEYTGLLVMQQILRHYQDRELPRSLSIFIGNVAAAEQSLRALPGQPDYNRIWGYGDTPEHQMTHQIMQEMCDRNVFAAVDIHNNTGKNPHFALICRHEKSFYHLAALFNRTVVYTVKPDTTSTWSMSEYCPAVTLECGLPGDQYGVAHAVEYIDACLHLSHFPEHPLPEHDMDLYHLVSIIKIPSSYSFSFNGTAMNDGTDIVFDKNLSSMNFSEIASGVRFCQIKEGSDAFLEAWDEHGKDRSDEYFIRDGEDYKFKLSVMPAMLTDDVTIIRMDCLCYLMERIDWKSIEDIPEDESVQVQIS